LILDRDETMVQEVKARPTTQTISKLDLVASHLYPSPDIRVM